jgi:V-type H+-transporting ATPase subunit H
MSLDPPPHLGQLQNNIRQRPIPWDGAVRANTLNEGQLAKIRAVDKVRKEQRIQTVEGDLDAYRILFVGGDGTPSVFESASKRTDVVQYLLVLLSDLLEGMSCSFPLPPKPSLCTWKHGHDCLVCPHGGLAAALTSLSNPAC